MHDNWILHDREQAALTSIPAECWRDAAAQEYEEMYVGDCGSFDEETDLCCEGFCLADSWLDCCDPKAGAIAALTMGCFFAFVGTLFSISWVLKCWYFKKPYALMLQAMQQQQQHARVFKSRRVCRNRAVQRTASVEGVPVVAVDARRAHLCVRFVGFSVVKLVRRAVLRRV